MADKSRYRREPLQFSKPRKWRGRTLRFVRNRLVLQYRNDEQDLSQRQIMTGELAKQDTVTTNLD